MEAGNQQQPAQCAAVVEPVGQEPADVVSDGDPGQHHSDHAGPGIQRLADVVSQQASGREFQHHDAETGDEHDGVAADQEPPGARPGVGPAQIGRVQFITGGRQRDRAALARHPPLLQHADKDQGQRDQPHHHQSHGGAADDQPRAVMIDQVEAGQEGADDRTQGRPGVDVADGEPGAAAARECQAGDDGGNRAQRNRRQQEDRRDHAQHPDRPAHRFGPYHSDHETVEHQRQATGERGQGEQDRQQLEVAETVCQHPAGVVADGDPGQDHADDSRPGVQRLADVMSQQPRGGQFQHHDADVAGKHDQVAADQPQQRTAPPDLASSIHRLLSVADLEMDPQS